ncbi:MAG TPA: GDP-L-fucose synthase, partial [candidate division Zixibacteria bacterium]|nr:GDP-L-fucose synthase [candidate division Zixibacteria bacterium]
MKNNRYTNAPAVKSSKIFIAGGTGLVGSAIIKNLLSKSYTNIIASYHNRPPATNNQYTDTPIVWYKLDLTDQQSVADFFQFQKPEYIFLAAAKVGGIAANNTYRADFIYRNLQIQNNIIHQSYLNCVKKLMFLGSTCIYPKNCPQPMKEEYLLTGELEYTNEPYAIAKIAGIKMCESYNLQYGTNFISVMPTNLYGPNDNFDLEKSHVLPALIRKIYLGKCLENNDWHAIGKDLTGSEIAADNSLLVVDENSKKEDLFKILNYYGIKYINDQCTVSIEIWGSGKPMREFLWSEDMADACVFLMENVDFKDIVEIRDKSISDKLSSPAPIKNTHLNIGTGKDISISSLAYLIKSIIGFKGDFYFNSLKPDGTMKKLTDVTKLNSFGWKETVNLTEGIE